MQLLLAASESPPEGVPVELLDLVGDRGGAQRNPEEPGLLPSRRPRPSPTESDEEAHQEDKRLRLEDPQGLRTPPGFSVSQAALPHIPNISLPFHQDHQEETPPPSYYSETPRGDPMEGGEMNPPNQLGGGDPHQGRWDEVVARLGFIGEICQDLSQKQIAIEEKVGELKHFQGEFWPGITQLQGQMSELETRVLSVSQAVGGLVQKCNTQEEWRHSVSDSLLTRHPPPQELLRQIQVQLEEQKKRVDLFAEKFSVATERSEISKTMREMSEMAVENFLDTLNTQGQAKLASLLTEIRAPTMQCTPSSTIDPQAVCKVVGSKCKGLLAR